mmetsp:Transcript_21859/g.65387  ORF Transcript_21859/g.65387 Transcript_21859/m.65387 type:complete len:213 (-) Transcript_21859:1536-2174(-)
MTAITCTPLPRTRRPPRLWSPWPQLQPPCAACASTLPGSGAKPHVRACHTPSARLSQLARAIQTQLCALAPRAADRQPMRCVRMLLLPMLHRSSRQAVPADRCGGRACRTRCTAEALLAGCVATAAARSRGSCRTGADVPWRGWHVGCQGCIHHRCGQPLLRHMRLRLDGRCPDARLHGRNRRLACARTGRLARRCVSIAFPPAAAALRRHL